VSSGDKSWKISLHLDYILENKSLNKKENLIELDYKVEKSFFVDKNDFVVLRK